MVLRKAHVLVEGRVQGVYSRDSTRTMAEGLGLSGYVRNLSDGRVEALFEGQEKAVQKALEFVSSGPPQARVDRVSPCVVPDAEETEGKKGFFILSTATLPD